MESHRIAGLFVERRYFNRFAFIHRTIARWGFVETNRYRPDKGLLTAVPGAVNTSPPGAKAEVRAAEADEDSAWFITLTRETFG